jgi:hypothetical protein
MLLDASPSGHGRSLDRPRPRHALGRRLDEAGRLAHTLRYGAVMADALEAVIAKKGSSRRRAAGSRASQPAGTPVRAAHQTPTSPSAA